MKSALSAKVAENDMIVLDSFTLTEYKTKEVVKLLNALGADRKVLLVMPEKNDMVITSARNIPGVKTALVNTLNVYDIVNADKFIVVKDAVAQIEEVYC
jgi:large subunit ribosomal protein L4